MRFIRSLKGRMTVIVAIAIVVTGTVVLTSGYFISRSILRQQVFRSMEGVVSRTKREIQTTVGHMEDMARLVSTRAQLRADVDAYLSGYGDRSRLVADIHNSMLDAQSAVPSFCVMSVLSLDGSPITSVKGSDPACRSAGRGEVSGQALKTVKSGRSWVDFDLKGGELVITIASGINRVTSGELIGITVINSQAKEPEMALTDLSGLGTTGETSLSKIQGGRVLALNMEEKPRVQARESDKNKIVSLDPGKDLPAVRAALGGNGEGETENLEGRKVIYAYGNVRDTGWGVTVTTDSAEAFEPLSRLRNVIIIVVLVLLFGGSALAFLIARSMLRPLVELQEGVKALAGGELTRRVQISDGTEVTTLAEEFNRMAGLLNELYESLEHKVEERTAELREANRSLKELDDLKNEFVSIASHELRSPLASMKMGVSTVYNEMIGPLNDEQKMMLSIANRNMDRLTNITSDLLDLTKVEAGQLDLEVSDCDLGKLANEVLEADEPQAKHLGLELKVDPGERSLVVKCDHDRIYQVIQNLVGNALKFTEEGGITISINRTDGDARVCVEDTGAGIPEEAMGTIFDKFSQAHSETRSEKRGTGLGLAICKGIVEAHGGIMTAESESGRGSRFCFTLPMRGPDEGAEADSDSG